MAMFVEALSYRLKGKFSLSFPAIREMLQVQNSYFLDLQFSFK